MLGDGGPQTTTPAGGGDPAGVVRVVDPREEEKIDQSSSPWEEVGFDETSCSFRELNS